MYGRILLASDGTMDAGGALEPAIALAQKFEAELTMLVVLRLPHVPISMGEVDDAKRSWETKTSFILSAAEQRARAVGVAFCGVTLFGPFATRTLAHLREHPADLLVLAHHAGSGGLGRILAAGTDRVLQRAPCSVHLVKCERQA